MTTRGECPKCGADLAYEVCTPGDGLMEWDVTCPGCEWEGYEVYTLKFKGHTDYESDGVYLEPSDETDEEKAEVVEPAEGAEADFGNDEEDYEGDDEVE